MLPEELRREATVAFASLPEPSFKYGLNVFFPTGSVRQPLELPAEHGAAVSRVTESDIAVTPLSDADSELIELIRERLTPGNGDRIDAWTIASANCIRIVRIAPGVSVDTPIRLDTALTSEEQADITLVVAEEGSAVTVVEHLSGNGSVRGGRTEIVARPGAVVTHISVQDFNPDVTSFDRRRALVEKDARITWIDCAFGGTYIRSRIVSELVGTGASARIMSLGYADGDQRQDVRHEVRHQASHTVSEIVARHALADKAKTVYRGLVNVAPGTRGCNGRQKEDTLLLSPDVEMSAMPDLEIGTGDVRAGHSASAGGLNKDKLFYLMSRGLDEEAASKTLIEAFFHPIVAEMREAGLREMVECLIAGKLDLPPRRNSDES